MPVDFDEQQKPYELFRKGKREGTWDPDDISLEQDLEDWEAFSDGEQLQFLGISSGFYEGEEDVTRTLAPYMIALEHLDDDVAGFDTVQEEMYLSQQVYEEAKHTDFFSRYFETVCGTHDTEKFLQGADDDEGYSIKDLYDKAEALREAAGDGDQTELVHTLADAYLEYMGIVEAQAARGGYMVFDQIIELKAEEMGRDVVLPGFQEGIGLVRQDETRHIENGRWVLRKLAEADPSVVPEVYEPRMEAYVESQFVSSDEDDFDFEEVYEGFDQRKIGRKTKQFLQDTVDYIGAEKFDRLADVDRAVDRMREAPADD